MKNAILRIPEFNSKLPIWWNQHGRMMNIFDADENCVILAGNGVNITITKEEGKRETNYRIEWEIKHGHHQCINGKAYFSRLMLLSAFGFLDDTLWGSEWLLDQYGGDCAAQGSFIRHGVKLNIPCPGTGKDGDPNISIELNKSIQNAVKKIVNL